MSQSERLRSHSQHSPDNSELFTFSTSSPTSSCIPKTINLKVNTLENGVNVINDINDSTSNSSTASSSSLSSSSNISPNFRFNWKTKSNSIDVDDKELNDDQNQSASQYSSFSISTFLRNEMEYFDMNNMDDSNNKKQEKPIIDLKTIDGTHSAQERIYNFFWLFFTLEKLLFFGFWICFDSFLLMITILPTRVLYKLYLKLSYLIKNELILLYYINIKYFTMYCFYTLKNCIIYIKDMLLYRVCCKKSISMNTTRKTINNGEYKEYFYNQYNYFYKLLCFISCCCIFNRDIYYNRVFERKLLLKEKKEKKEKKEEKEEIDIDQEWLINLKKEIYDRRIKFLNNFGFGYIYTERDYLDIIRLLTLFLCVYILTQFNLSQIYHFIRAQENFKLYVLFKIIVIIEHLLSSFGEDSIESLCNDGGRNIINLIIYILYNILHSLLLYGHLITLNAAMNSPNNTLITILVADNFYELKSTVFKKYQIENVFQMLCSDVVERFTIFLFVLLILLQNLCYLGWDNFDAEEWFIDAFQLFLIMIGFEIIVDTIKHGFICKFNNLSINIYKSFHIRLSMDFINKSYFFMDRRLGFSSLPLVTLFLRVMWQISEYNDNHKYVKVMFIIFSFIIVYLFKLLLSLIIIARSIKKLKKHKPNQQYLIAKQLYNVTRYALIIKKIPI